LPDTSKNKIIEAIHASLDARANVVEPGRYPSR
jgi:hypothetical protein